MLLKRILPEDARAALLVRLQQAEANLLLAQPEKMLRAALRGQDLFSLTFHADTFLRAYLKFLSEFDSFVTPYEELLKPLQRFIEIEHKIQTELPREWKMFKAQTFSNHWDLRLNMRKNNPLTVYRLRNQATASHLDFYIADAESVHGLLFRVGAECEGMFFAARKDFSAVTSALFKVGFKRLTASVLTCPEEYPLQHSKEWRTEEIQGMSRLMKFWRRLGAVKWPNKENAVSFYHPTLAPEVKATFEKEGLPNPFALLNRSIYPKELEKALRTSAKHGIYPPGDLAQMNVV